MSDHLANGGPDVADPVEPDSQLLLRARGIRKSFDGRKVLNGVDLDLELGTISVLMGRSGSGKSTLLRLIAGLDEPDEGELDVCGVPAVRDGERTDEWDDVASKIGMIFQNYTLWPHMNVYENLALAPRRVLREPAAQIKERAARALSEVGMEHHMYSKSTQLSGGERQRVAIARALMMRPTVLLCDEITSALDPPVSAEVLGVLSRLKRDEGIACLLVTHDVAFASRAADRFIFFEDGEIIENTTAAQAIAAPQTQSLKDFLAALHF
ncbi:amino acid ABC transporter ATP-binding protein [Agromyces aerolatus]|uniref:amino acid ABC transporter ATP-binding protein n=1 Tax=Agromyces sp. LY-1074 TaxID=3074080 RepID=UPI002866ABF0|nr:MULTISPECIES: ATP-binding cassette domain-containing protein [unclassified Agromyces]MDR5701646.1 ATP-binding cassette domain-containing protein [Agromyces sp. LY-1074]MDR5707914.1 ATP-binding cassette domain-containing protein [Agromyces sp. LY-1358]